MYVFLKILSLQKGFADILDKVISYEWANSYHNYDLVYINS